MLKHLIVALATSLALFSTAPVALADNITNSPSITTSSGSGSSSQGLTPSKATAKIAKSGSNSAGKAGVRSANKLGNAGQKSANKSLKQANDVGSSVSRSALNVSGGTILLPKAAGNATTNIFGRAKTVINWAGQNTISVIVMFVIFAIAICILVTFARLVFAIFGLGKTPIGKLLIALLALIIIFAAISGAAGWLSFGTGIFQVISWIFTGH